MTPTIKGKTLQQLQEEKTVMPRPSLVAEQWEKYFDEHFTFEYPPNQISVGKRVDGKRAFTLAAVIKDFIRHQIDQATTQTAEAVRAEERKAKDQAYWERNQLVVALSKLFPAWIGYHPAEDKEWEDDWRTIVYIKIPVEKTFFDGRERPLHDGQISWHIHDDDKKYFSHLDPGIEEWDGHSTEEKYNRLLTIKDTKV